MSRLKLKWRSAFSALIPSCLLKQEYTHFICNTKRFLRFLIDKPHILKIIFLHVFQLWKHRLFYKVFIFSQNKKIIIIFLMRKYSFVWNLLEMQVKIFLRKFFFFLNVSPRCDMLFQKSLIYYCILSWKCNLCVPL